MGLFNRHWLDEGYYEDDGYGDFTKIDESDINMLSGKYRNDLYYHDGYSLNKVNNIDKDEEIEP